MSRFGPMEGRRGVGRSSRLATGSNNILLVGAPHLTSNLNFVYAPTPPRPYSPTPYAPRPTPYEDLGAEPVRLTILSGFVSECLRLQVESLLWDRLNVI